MLRYLAISTVLVVGTLVAVTAYHNEQVVIRVEGGRPTGPPRFTDKERDAAGALSRPLHGDAAWALSALPECLVQTQEWRGTLRFALAHMPRGEKAIVPPAVLHYADCTISIDGTEATVRRGPDELRIPPVSRFYHVHGGIALLHTAGVTTLRLYRKPR